MKSNHKEHNILEKRSYEKQILTEIVRIYCKGKHQQDLCDNCKQLLQYGAKRVDNCRRIEDKQFCSTCPTKCYSKAYREKIGEVMRYGGPRLLCRHPILVIKHVWLDIIHRVRRTV